MGMTPRGIGKVAPNRCKIDGRGTDPATIGGGLAAGAVDLSDHGEMKFPMVLGAGGDGMGAGADVTTCSPTPLIMTNCCAAHTPESCDSDWESDSDELVGKEELHDLLLGSFFRWGVPDDEATEEVQEKVKTSNRFRVLVKGEFVGNQMDILAQCFEPFDASYQEDMADATKTLGTLRFATQEQMQAAIEHLPGLAKGEGIEMDIIARVGTNGGIKSGGLKAMHWCAVTINGLSRFEGIYPNFVRVDRLPVTPDTDVEDLERKLFWRMRHLSVA
eukprot:g11266.t1